MEVFCNIVSRVDRALFLGQRLTTLLGGTYLRVAFSAMLVLLLSMVASAQTFILKPATAENADGEYETKLLLKKSEAFRLLWSQADGSSFNLNGQGAKLIIGRSSNTYNTLALDVSGTQSDFVPDNIGLSAGRYYARITNSTARTSSEIQADQQANPGSIIYSNEILLLIEANEAPAIIAPRGTITNATPTFQWTAVSGVPSYWLIVSSTPFDIVEDDGGNISIEGATVVWQYITKETTAEYGDINRDSPFTDEAPPLNANQEYSYTILNVYEENNPVYTSPVFGGIVPFTYSDPNAVPKSTLQSPAAEAEFFSEETITFEWTDVPEATNYTINLLQIVKQQGIDVTVPIWTSTTTNTLIEYPAIENLKNGRYQWNVISNNTSGGGTTSNSRFFQYNVETGEFAAQVTSSADNSSLLGVELTARAISGGVTPSIPYFVQSETHYDSLVAGTYEFKAVKTGYEDAVATGTIRDGQQTYVGISMEPLPSSIKGTVVDEEGENLENATVIVKNVADNSQKQASTDVSGEFSVSLQEGSYQVSVSKSGYISPASRSVTVGLNEQFELASNMVLTNDQATVSGTIYNDEGEALQRATVTITNGTVSYETKSNGSGNYQFTVASGNWTLSVSKVGFVKPTDEDISLSTGDILTGTDFTLTGNANQITGFVRERVTNDDGTTGTAPFEGIEVKAIPTVGTPITTVSATNGQYTLSLKSGSYSIQAVENNYSTNQDRELVIGIAVGETISGMDFEMVPNPSSISGTITLPNGNGVSSATVTIPDVGTATTSSSGYYSISVPEGSHRISATKSGLVSPTPKTVTVNVGQNLTGVNFEMTPNAGSIAGKVSSGGEALSNTTLTAVNTTSGQKVAITNQLNGNYTFNVASGNWYVKAEKSGFISDSTEALTVGPGQSIVGQNFTLIKNLTTVRGTVTDGVNPVRNTQITVNRANSSFSQSSVTQINGTYAFSLPAGYTYTITAAKDGYKSSSKSSGELVPEQTVVKDFALSANPSSISGKVSISGDGVLTGAKVMALNGSGTKVDSTTTKTDGTYLLGLDPATYTIRVSKAGYTSGSKSSTVSIGQNLTGINYTVDENFVFISGTITDSDGNGLEQVFVNLTRTGGNGASTVTDQDGAFSFSGLIGGSYSIALSKSGYVSKTISKTAVDGEFLTVDASLVAKNGSVSGTVTDENGVVLANATITATSENGTEYTGVSDAQGAYTLSALELSDYTINASLTGYTRQTGNTFSLTEDVLNVTGVAIDDLIPNNATISGTITAVGGSAGIKDVQISVTGPRGSGVGNTTSSGTYSLANLTPDTYTVIVRKTGYKPDTAQVEIDPGSPNATFSTQLLANNGKILGTITDSNGDVLPFRVTVTASNSTTSLTTQTNNDGEFIFEGVETGVEYAISTDIYRDGYDNSETSILVPTGASQTVIPDEIEVPIRNSEISGTTGVGSATVKLLDGDTDQILDIATSGSSGSYAFTFLADGRYKLVAQKLGYIFNTDTTDVIVLPVNNTQTVNFTAQPNIATLDVKITRDGANVSNADVTIISADTSVVLNKKTGANGIARFSAIEASTSYTVRAVKEGFTSSPGSRNVSLSSGDSTTTNFTMSANDASITGLVKTASGSNLRDAKVLAILTSTGQSTEATTSSAGTYTFGSIASGTYDIVASKSGFTSDTVSVTVNPGGSVTSGDLTLTVASVRISGKVVLKGVGVQGVEVTALSSATYTATTNSTGNFSFASLPVKTGATDTTTYQIKIKSGVFTKSYTRQVVATQIGKTITLPTTDLPSGQITLTVTDGVDPIGGAEIVFGISGGESESIVTGAEGAFVSDDNLRKANYVVSVFKEGFLYPENTIRLALETDTSQLTRDVYLPYVQSSVDEILANQKTEVKVQNPVGYDNSGASGVLYYKQESASSFTSVDMTLAGDSLVAEMPVFGSVEEVTFYTAITDTIRNNVYLSNQTSIVPLASGILSNIRVTPTVSGQRLRAGDSYSLDLFIRDGINKSLTDKFIGDSTDGNITWSVLNEATGIELTGQSGTAITLEAKQAGTYTVQVTADLDGSSVSRNLNLEVTEIPIGDISVSVPAKQISNSSTHLFSYAAKDTSGAAVMLGNGVTWSVLPSSAGTIDARGVFEPSGSSIIGTFNVAVSDPVSEKLGISDDVELIARIEPDEAYTLTDGNGLELSLLEGSVDIPSQLSLGQTTPPATKKFVFAQGSDVSYTVSDKIYILSFSGSELKKSATITLPEDSSLILNSGNKELARFNFTTLQWELLNGQSKSVSGAAGSASTSSLGQFAILAENEPLGIKYAAVLPSPFSPDVAPVKIGYWLDTAFPPAKVNIRIYNIRGELVRTLVEDDLQQPGRYGSSSSSKEIIWDGLTDAGNMARNGRYVVQIKAKDQQGEVVKLLQVVLIK